jgi:hypothetical protein
MGVPKASGLHVIPQRAGTPGHPHDAGCAPLVEADATITPAAPAAELTISPKAPKFLLRISGSEFRPKLRCAPWLNAGGMSTRRKGWTPTKTRGEVASVIVLIPPEECCAVYGGTIQFGMATPVCPRRCVVTKRRPRMNEANLIRLRFRGPPKKNAKEENPATTPAAPAAATPRLFTVSLLLRGNLSRLTARRQ